MITLPVEVWVKIYGMKRQMEFNDLVEKMDRKLKLDGPMEKMLHRPYHLDYYYYTKRLRLGFLKHSLCFGYYPLSFGKYRIFTYDVIAFDY